MPKNMKKLNTKLYIDVTFLKKKKKKKMRELTIAKVHKLMQEKKLTADDLSSYYLDRIDKYDIQGP